MSAKLYSRPKITLEVSLFRLTGFGHGMYILRVPFVILFPSIFYIMFSIFHDLFSVFHDLFSIFHYGSFVFLRHHGT